MAQTYTELQGHIDQLWKIIEQQEKQIQELKSDNQKICSERDDLQEKLHLITSRETTASISSQVEKLTELESTDIDKNNNSNGDLILKQNSVDYGNPILPTRSPFRETDSNNVNNNSSTKLSLIGVANLDNSTTTSLSISQGPVSPKIIEHDAKLFAQYQSAVLKRDMIDNKNQKQQTSPITLVPSKSSTLPSQSRDSRVVNRKQHNSMVFPSSIIIPTNSKKEDILSATHPLDQSPLHRSRSNTIQQHPTAASSQLPPNELNSISDVTVKVVGSVLKSNEKGKDVVAFILSVGKHQNSRYEELWRVEKLYSDFLDLDLKLKTQMDRNNIYKMTRLPEKQLFATRSPNKLDQRRMALEKYLQNAITLPMDDIGDLCEFLSTDVIEQPSYTNERKKEGYLIKRGKNFGGWKTRYFVIKKKRLDYYEAKDGSRLGSIQLEGAQIGRQTSPDTMDENENVYRNAFLIVEPKKTTLGNFTKHILCASNNNERDEWITALMEVIHYSTERDSVHSSTPQISPMKNTSSSTSLTTEKQRKKSADKRKPSKGEIRTVAATPISQLRIDPSQVIDMEKLISVHTTTNNNTKDECSTAVDSTLIETLPLEMNDNSSSIRSNSLSLSSPLSVTSVDSPLTPNQQYQFNNFGYSSDKFTVAPSIQQQLDHNNSTDDLADISNTLSPDSPVPASQLDRKGSDDSTTNEQQQQQTDKKNKSKAANRMTLLGKKIFGNQQRSSANQMEGNIINSNSNNMSNGRSTSPILNHSNTSYHPLANVSQEQHQQKGSTQKSLRHILSRSQSENSDHTSSITNHPSNSKLVFGVSLEEAVRVSCISKNYHLPAIVFRCIEYLDAKNAVLEEGLYRLSGSNIVIQNLKKRFDQEGDIPLLNSKEEYDVHAIAGLLKMWLRELPVSVLTRELWPEFIKVIDLLERKDRINELGRLVSLLPLENYTLLRILIAHLISVVKHSDTNKMTVRNISIVFSLTLGIPGTIFNLFLGEFDYIFWTTNDDNTTPRKISKSGDSTATDGKVEDTHSTTTLTNNTKLEEHLDSQILKNHKPSNSNDMAQKKQSELQKNNNSGEFLQPVSSVVVPRRLARKFAANDENGRNNRNSVCYEIAAPKSMVNLEKHNDGRGPRVTEDDEEVEEFAMRVVTEDENLEE